MLGGIGQQIFHDAARQFTCALVLLQYDIDFKSGPNVAAHFTVACHTIFPL
jgi:hypothetical protein